MKLLSIILFCLVLTTSYCQNEKTYREAYKLELAVDSEHYYSMNVPQSPYLVKENILQIYPGEKVLLETEIKNDTLFSMKVVEKNLHPERTIEVNFFQDASDKLNINMFLNVKNPFDKTLIHDALMYTVGGNQWQETTIIPIKPKLQNFETWGYTIITLVLDNWRFAK